jgi:UDP-N-acetylmuramoyl-L-alanyl-D-glutamate--2,6-diaminopimelate ligase
MASSQLRPQSVSLRGVLRRAKFTRGGDLAVAKCSSDWRDCSPGDLFVALTTADEDGHDHAPEAIARGAVAVVAERLVPVAAPVVLVKDTRVALARITQALAGHPCRQLRTIGITGTAGKTVTAMLLASIFEKAGEAVGVLSSIGYSDSLTQTAPRQATPTTGQLADWLGRMATAGCDSAVIELSSRALAERRAAGLELDAAVLTNIGRDHLDLHNTPQAYRRAKRRMFSLLKAGGVAVVNADDHRCRNLLPAISAACLTYGLYAEADITATVVERHRSEQTFVLSAGGESVPVRSRMIGDHHVSNCLAAAAVGLSCGLDLTTIVQGLEAIDHVPGRLERLECGQPFGVFVDAAASPETLALSIKAVRRVTAGRVIVVAGCPGHADKSVRPLVGRVLEKSGCLPVLTASDPRHEEPLAAMHDLLDGFERPQKAHVLPDRAAAIRYALTLAGPGDSVLITGKGDRQGQIIGSKRLPHDDREVARQWLYERGAEELAGPRLRIVG